MVFQSPGWRRCRRRPRPRCCAGRRWRPGRSGRCRAVDDVQYARSLDVEPPGDGGVHAGRLGIFEGLDPGVVAEVEALVAATVARGISRAVGEEGVEVEPGAGPCRLRGQARVGRARRLAVDLDDADVVHAGGQPAGAGRGVHVEHADVVAVGARRIGRPDEGAGAGGFGHAHDGRAERRRSRAVVAGVAERGDLTVAVAEPVAGVTRGDGGGDDRVLERDPAQRAVEGGGHRR